MSASALGVLFVLVTGQVPALRDDFEALTGPWAVRDEGAQTPIVNRAVAARRGNFGVRFVDESSGSGSGTESRLARVWPQRPSRIMGRGFFRAGAMSMPSDHVFFNVNSNFGNGNYSLAAFEFHVPGGGVTNQVFDANGFRESEDLAGATMAPGEWHLAELLVEGLGTANGCVKAAFDGVPRHERCGLQLSQAGPPEAIIGFPWQAPRAARGSIDADDVAYSESVMASRLVLTPAAVMAKTGECVKVEAALESSWGGAAPAAFDETVPAAPGFATFSDAACGTAVDGLALVAGTASASVFVKPLVAGTGSPLAAPLSVMSSGAPSWVVTGEPMGSAPLESSCGCHGAPGGLALLVLVLRHRPRTSSARSRPPLGKSAGGGNGRGAEAGDDVRWRRGVAGRG
ncbi:MAG: hypothetical protein JNK82_17965 [Myxococcaceae bacterium]|nr:hypothetical protein [Myxococcaceae bacterium]